MARTKARRLTGLLAATALPAVALTLQTAGPAAAAPPPPTQTVGQKVVKVAKKEYKNKSRNKANNKGKYNCNYYSGYWKSSGSGGCDTTSSGVRWRANEWCADFVWYTWRKAGAPKRPMPNESGYKKFMQTYAPTFAGSFYRFGKKYKTYHSRSYYGKGTGRMPLLGSAVVFDWSGSGKPGHNGWNDKRTGVGIDHVGVVISFNYDKNTITTIEGNSNGQAIRSHTYSLKNKYIVGFTPPKK